MQLLSRLLILALLPCSFAAVQMERLDRGFIAIHTPTNVFLSWRLLTTDPTNVSFNIFEEGRKLNAAPIANATSFQVTNSNGGALELRTESVTAKPLSFTNYLSIPLQLPAGY